MAEAKEMLEDPNVPLPIRQQLLVDLDRVNARFGIYSDFLRGFERWLPRRPGPLKVLELGPGACGLIVKLSQWAARTGRELEFHLFDVDARILDWQQELLAARGISAVPHLATEGYLK